MASRKSTPNPKILLFYYFFFLLYQKINKTLIKKKGWFKNKESYEFQNLRRTDDFLNLEAISWRIYLNFLNEELDLHAEE